MTCIVGVKGRDGQAYIGGDSFTEFNGTLVVAALPKIFEVGEFRIGTSGTRRHGEVLQYRLAKYLTTPLTPGATVAELDAYMATDFSDAVWECMQEGGCLYDGEKSNTGQVFGGNGIIGVRGEVYHLTGDFSVTRALEVAACGIGMDYALAALMSRPELPPRERCLFALQIAASLNSSVAPPYDVLPRREASLDDVHPLEN